jgi:hypothetical protein
MAPGQRLRLAVTCLWIQIAALAALLATSGTMLVREPTWLRGLVAAAAAVGLAATLWLRFAPNGFYSPREMRRRVGIDETGLADRDSRAGPPGTHPGGTRDGKQPPPAADRSH